MNFMIPFLPLIPILIVAAVAVTTLSLLRRPAAAVPVPSEYGRLDKAGLIVNWILGILYLPLSLFFFLMGGMASEICMDSMTPAKEALRAVPSIMALFSFFISEGGILASVLLRRQGKSKLSFVIQFAGLAYGCVMLLLIMFL